MNWIKIIHVAVSSPLALRLSFNDGLTGEIDMGDYANSGLFSALQDFQFFKQVSIVRDGRAIEWPGELDLCADSLHELVLSKKYSQQEIFPNASNQ
jgi:hypothetical protein